MQPVLRLPQCVSNQGVSDLWDGVKIERRVNILIMMN